MSKTQVVSINQLGELPVSKLVIKYSLPAVLGLLFNALYSFVDRIFIGNSVGAIGIAAVALVFPFTQIIGSFASLVGMGASSLISRKLGEKDKNSAETILGNSVLMLAIISVIVTVGGIFFSRDILRILGASSEVLPYAKEYLNIILLGTIFQVISLGMNYFLRVDGSPKKAMLTMFIGNILNTILCPILIFGFDMGMQGAAIATVISQGITSIWVTMYFFNGKSFLKIALRNIKLKGITTKDIFIIGLPSSFMIVSLSLATIIQNNRLKIYGGDISISAMGAISSVLFLAVLPIFGINQGVQPIIGYNYGAKAFDRVKKASILALVSSFAIALICFIVVMIIPRPIMSMFGNQTEFLNFGVRAMRMSMMMVFFSGVPIIVSGYFQAIGDSKKAIVLTVCRNIFFMIPLLLILPSFLNLDGVLIATPLSDLLSFIFAMTLYIPKLKRLKKI